MSVTLRIGRRVLHPLPIWQYQIMKFLFSHIIIFSYFLWGKYYAWFARSLQDGAAAWNQIPATYILWTWPKWECTMRIQNPRIAAALQRPPGLRLKNLLGSLIFTVAIIYSSAMCLRSVVNCIINSTVAINKTPVLFTLFFFLMSMCVGWNTL